MADTTKENLMDRHKRKAMPLIKSLQESGEIFMYARLTIDVFNGKPKKIMYTNTAGAWIPQPGATYSSEPQEEDHGEG